MTLNRFALPALAAVALVALGAPAASQCPPGVLAPSSGDGSDLFGYSVDVDGTRAVVGAPFEGAADTGAAYVYDWNGETSTWVETARLTPTPTVATTVSQFGYSVAVSGDRIVVGAPFSGIVPGLSSQLNLGAAYVFEELEGAWIQVAELDESTRGTPTYQIGAQLGTSVDIEGDTVIVGLPAYSVGFFPTGIGAVNVYEAPFAGVMTEHAHLDRQDLDPTAIQGMALGQAVALEGDTIVGGAASDDSTSGPGRVFVFERLIGDWSSGTIVKAVLTNSDAEVGAGAGTHDDQFGRALALSGDTIAVSAYAHSVGAEASSGKVYLFEKPGSIWADATETTAFSNGGFAGRYGRSVALDATAGTLVIGDDLASSGKGAGHVYQKVGGAWTWAFSLSPPAGSVPQIGTSAAISGAHKLLGAPYTADVPATPHGVVWDLDTPLVSGSATVRNGDLDINPVTFVSVTTPTIGKNWESTVDIVTPGAISSFVGIGLGGPWSGTPLTGLVTGELLIQLAPEPIVHIAAGAHSLPVPLECDLIGVSLSTQGATFDVGEIQLTNALDLVFGSY